MSALVVTIPVVWGVRNVLRSGLGERLAEHVRVVYAVPRVGRARLLDEGVPPENVWVLDDLRPSALQGCCSEALGRLHRSRHGTASDAILPRGRARGAGWRGRAGRALVGALESAGRAPGGFELVRALEARECMRSIPDSLASRIASLRPLLVLSTSFIEYVERPLVVAARRAGVRTMTHVQSFDNLTSRGYVHLRHFDRFLAWSDGMADELRTHYGVAPSDIEVTGTPQFDAHVRDVWSREATARRLGIDPRRPYVVYSANLAQFTPSEPELVARLIEEWTTDPALGECQWVVRPHPIDGLARWQRLVARLEQRAVRPLVRFCTPWERDEADAGWAMPSRDDIALLGNTLRHAAATMQVASTCALDSMIVGTPVVSVGFHPEAPAEGEHYARLHESHHYRAITESEAAPLARSLGEAHALMREALSDPARRHGRRAALVARVCGVVDGHAADRVADAVLTAVQAEAARR